MIRTIVGSISAGETKDVFTLHDIQGLDEQVKVKKVFAIADAAGTGTISIKVSSGIDTVTVAEDVNATAGDKTQIEAEDIDMSQSGLRNNEGVSKVQIYSEDAAKYYMVLEPNNK